jgi:hypothetical protein
MADAESGHTGGEAAAAALTGYWKANVSASGHKVWRCGRTKQMNLKEFQKTSGVFVFDGELCRSFRLVVFVNQDRKESVLRDPGSPVTFVATALPASRRLLQQI